MKMVKRISLISLIGLISSTTALAAPTEFSSKNYRLIDLQFGHQLALTSREESVGPQIAGEGPQVSDVKDTTATIKWTTDKSSNSIVLYGKAKDALTSEAGKSNELVKSHEVQLVGLDPDTTYYFKVSSKDKAGNVGQSETKEFTTKKTAAISEVQITDITLSSVIVSFKTSSIVNATINYGTTTDYGKEIKESSGSLTTNHSLRISSLTQGTTYHLRITAEDEFKNKKFSDDYIFSTLPIPDIVSISLKNVTSSEATLVLEANTSVSVQVEYYTNEPVEVAGVKPGQKQVVGSGTTSAKSHELKLVNLIGNAKYFYKVIIIDNFGNRSETGENSFSTSIDRSPPVLTPPKVEQSLINDEQRDKVRLIVTWTTDKPATSQLLYQTGQQLDEKTALKTAENTAFLINHFVVIDVKPSTNYGLKAISRDRAGNIGKSQVTTVLTPKKQRSILQFVIERLTETFGGVLRFFNK